jgi:hypothetical protein
VTVIVSIVVPKGYFCALGGVLGIIIIVSVVVLQQDYTSSLKEIVL